MTYAFGIYFEDDDNLGLVAAGNRWTSGGNSAVARRLRVAMQRRDRYGRWAEMGGGISFLGRLADGSVQNFVGRYVGPAERQDYMRVYVTDGRRPGIYEVPSKVSTVAKALLKEEDLKNAGVQLDVNGKSIGKVLDRDIEFVDQMWKGNKPTDFELDMARGKVTPKEKKTIVKARLKAPAHKSYNVVDENGVRIDKDEVPSTPDVKKPSKKAKPAEVFPLPDLDKDIAEENPKKWATLSEEERAAKLKKERSRRDFYAGADGKRIPDNKLTDADKTPENRRIRDLKNHRVLDGNGRLIEFIPEYKTEANPVPQGEFHPVEDKDEGFWNANQVKPGEVQKDLTTPEAVYEALYNGGFVEVSPELALAAVDVAMNDLPYLGRDENPLFQSNPTDPRFREIANILSSLPPAQETRLKRAINLALMSEDKINALKAYLDDNVEEGTGLSPEAMKELHRKFRNLGVDLTNMRIKGQDAFTNDNLGAERINMPQLDEADQADFLAYCDKLGIKYKEALARPQQLHPIQAEMDMGDVGKIMASWLSPELRKKYGMDDQYLFVTRDGYVLDGHHRWSSALLAEMKSGQPINLKVMVLDMDHEDALKFVNEYNDHVGITRQMVGGKNVAQPRPEAPKAEIPTGPIQPTDLMLNRAPSRPSGALGPDGSSIESWLDKQLKNNGDLITAQFADRLTEDKPNQDPEDRLSPIPGSRTVVTNLLKYRDGLRAGLIEASLDGDKEGFRLKFEVAKRVSNLLNQIYDNYLNGHDYTKDTEIALSTSNPDEKLKAFRILPNSITTVTDNNGIKRITELQAITIGKNGAPYIIKWNCDEYGEAKSRAWMLNPNGSFDFNDTRQPSYGGGLSIHRVQDYKKGTKGKYIPKIAEVGGAFTDEHHRAVGLMSGHIFLTRWVQTQFMENARLAHSSNLRPNGTFYGKTVSKDMRDHHREQADKAVHQNNPNGEIFKVLKAMGLVNGTFVPFDKNASDNQPGGGGANSGGSGWLRRVTIVNTRGWSDTKSVLDSYNVHDAVRIAKENYFDGKTDAEKAQMVANMPEIFRDFFDGDPNRPEHMLVENFDIQYKLLGTVYKDGMNKDETLAFLDSVITGLPELSRALGTGDRLFSANTIAKLQSIRDAVDNHAWDDANNQYNRPKPFNTNSIRVLESPFAGNFKFSDWTIDRNFKRISNELPFTPKPKPNGAPDHWTEDPNELQARYAPETLLEVLKSALKDEKGKVAHLPQDNNGNSPIDVDPTAVYKALENNGYDTELMLASIYDEINGNTANMDALRAKRAELGNLDDIIAKLVKEVGVLEEPVAFSKIGGQYDPQNGGVLQSDLIKRNWENVDGNPALDLRDLEPVNETYVDANRNELISSNPYTPRISNREFYTAGVADNPKIIARNFSPSGLRNALTDALQNNRTTVKLKFPNGQEREVPNAAIRDALQHQGYDINRLLGEIPGLRPKPKRLGSIATEIGPNNDLAQHWTGIGTREFSDNTPVLLENVSVENAGRGLSPNGNSYEIGLTLGAEDKRKTFTAKLAKIQKNADGKYEVWIAKKEDNFTGDFSGTPDGVYSSFENALYDVQKHVADQVNAIDSTNVGANYAREPRLSGTLTQYGVINNDSPDAIEVAGLRISRPDNTGTTTIFENTNGLRRINNASVNGSTFVYSIHSNPLADEGSPFESMVRHTKDADGNQVDSPIYNIIKVSDQNLNEKYAVELFGLDSVGAPLPKQTVIVSDLEIAKNIAKLQIKKSNSSDVTLTGINENTREISNAISAVQPEAAIDNKQIISDRAMTVATTPVKLHGGVEAKAVVTIKKGKHPAWRRGVPDADNRYVYATVEITSPDGSQKYGSYDLVRTSIRRWTVQPKLGNLLNDNNSPFIGNLRTYSNYWNDKEDALNDLKNRINRHFLSQEQQGENKTLFPEERVVNVAAPAQNAINPAVPPRPAENFLSEDKFSDFVAQRGEVIDLSAATLLGGMGLGASGSQKYELNGKKYKVKIEGGDKARQESFNHAIYKLTGIQVTEARIGAGSPNQFMKNRQDVGFVVADEFEPDIVPGRVNGHMNGQSVFYRSEFRKPENQQAIADLQEGLLMDVLTNNGDVMTNPGNSFIAIRNGVRRGVRCDNGSGGVYEAIGTGRSSGFITRNAADRLTSQFGDFMNRGVVNGTNDDGSMKRGLTPEALQGIARRTILPLTDEKIDALVQGIITNPQDKRELAEHLKRRRLEMLNYMGIDPNEEPPQGTSAVVPNVIPGNIPPTMADNGYEFISANANGVDRVRIKGSINPNGAFVPDNYDSLPQDVKAKLENGLLLPENLPFISDSADRPKLVIDGAGIVRPIGKNGMTSIFIRKRKADGTYEYLFTKQGRNGNQQLLRTNQDKIMPIVHGNTDAADTSLSEMLAIEGFAGIPIVSSKEMRLAIPGLGQDHRIIVADIGSEDISGVIDRASQNGVIRDVYWRIPERLTARADLYYNQLNGNDDKNNVINQIKEWERTWSASPSAEPSADNGDNGGDGNGPTGPVGNGGGPSNSGSSSTSGPSDDGWMATRSMTFRDANGNVNRNNGGVVFQSHPNGGIRVFDDSNNEVQGEILPTYHGHWVATFMPNDIDNVNRDRRNGRAIKGIFASKQDAANWLAKKVYDKYGVPEGDGGNRRPFNEGGTGDYNPNAAPYVEIKKGFLNPTTENQRNLANRLVDHKQATPEERSLFRAMLTQDNLTVGEVGYVINKLKDRDDRDSAELAESRRVRDEAAAANPVQPSTLERVIEPPDVVPVMAKDLRPGHRILGKVNGNVVFTAEGENNTINVGVVKDDGKLRVYKVSRNTMIACSNQQVAQAATNAVPTHPVIQQRRAQARLIQDQIKALYPNHRELPNGDLIVGQRDHRQADGRVFRYEAVVHKLKSDEFISYVRKQQIDTNGNPVGESRAAYLTVPGHSPKAVKGRLAREVMSVINSANPANGFNQKQHEPEVTNPATGLPLPASLVNQNAQFIGTTGIEKTGNATKDALISYVQNLIARGMAHPEIIDQVIGRNQIIFSRHQMDDIIERLEWNRQFPGTNAIPYVSKDNKTIVRVGDRVTHYDADGNPKLMANGQPRTGIVTERRPYTLNRKPNGDYEYTDQLYVQWDDTNRPHQAAARRLEVNRRADGTQPVPAVQGPNDGGNNNPVIPPMPLPRNTPGQRPANPAPAPADNSVGLREAISANPTIKDLVDNKGGQIVAFPGDEQVRIIHPQSNGNNFGVAQMEKAPNGEYLVTDYSNGDQFGFVRKEVALQKLEEVVANFVRDVNPVAYNAPTNAPENNDSGIEQLVDRFNSNRIPEGFVLHRRGGPGTLGNGNPISLVDAEAAAQGYAGLRGRISQDNDGKFVVQKWSNNGGFVGEERYPDVMTALEVLSQHATSLRNEKDGGNTPSSSSPSSSSPSSPNGGDGGGVPPTNPPAGGDGGASEGPGLDLNMGRWRQGSPPDGVAPRPGDGVVPKVNTFWDDDQPPTQYDVVRDENRTKFVGRAGQNPGAEAFVYVEKTPTGNWRVVDPRERGDARYSAEYGNRNIAEAIAINKMAGREEYNRLILGQENAPNGNTPVASPTPAVTDSESPTSGNSDSGLRVGENRAPDGMVENREANGDFTADFTIGQNTFQRVRKPDGSTSYFYNGTEIATIDKNSDGTFNVKTMWAKNNSDFVLAKDETDALLNAQSQIWRANQDGRIEQIGQNAPATPQVSPQITPAVPATPGQPKQESVPEFAPPGYKANGQMNVGGGVGGQNDFRDITPQPQEGAILRQHNPQNIGGDYNPGFYWENPDGTVAEWDFNRDGQKFMRPRPPSWEEPDNSGVRYQPGDVFDPNHRPDNGNNNGGTPPTGPSDNGGNGGNGGTPPANNPPAGPAPVAPEAEPVQEPQGKPRVNRIQPGDRYVKQNNRLLPNKNGKYTGFDVYDARTKKLIATAETKEIADDIAAGRRDLNGKLIDYTTPQKPGIQRVPRPEGYSKNITPDSKDRMFNKDFYIENLKDPNSPVVRLNYDEANAQYVGQLYANKEDAKNQRNPIGESFANSAQIRAEDTAHERLQKELDKKNPVPATQAPNSPQGQLAPNHKRNDLGSDAFTVTDGNNEYGVAERVAPDMWMVRVHSNARDGVLNRNPISTGSYDNAEDAEAAIRKAIDRNQAQKNQANMLQWQSGSDGKQYLGLDGVPGVDAENGPVYGISPSPFGGWAMARWDSKASKDAGAQPSSIVAHPDEEAAKNDALKQINDFLRKLTGQNPPLVNDENPTTPNGNGNGNAPEITPEDQSPLYTPFNPNA
jgi:hypothetical protein